mmetsp:Transcript_311/g.570  ORF Transcript_311/g.570 Transcript_311/m.570 type:complete len:245 (+) Transcript_311:200-934(+)
MYGVTGVVRGMARSTGAQPACSAATCPTLPLALPHARLEGKRDLAARLPAEAAEVRVLERVFRGNARLRSVQEHLLHEVEACVVEPVSLRHCLTERPRLPLGEVCLEVGQLRDTLPQALVGRTEQPEDFEDLIDLGVTREHRVASDHLGDDGANRPHVDRARILLCAEQDLGRTVPERDHLVRVRAQRHRESARESKVRQLERASLWVNKHVLRLEITVEDAVRVAPREPSEHLVSKRLDALGA